MTNAPGLAQTVKDLYDLLEPLDPEDRRRAVTAVMTLYGEAAGNTQMVGRGSIPNAALPSDAQAFFDDKDPRTKTEEYAVAARFRELTTGAHTHTKEDFEDVITSARRNFNDAKYRRDIENAKAAALFNRGDGNTLSGYGQKYVDALPDRENAKAVTKPKTAPRRGKARGKPKAAKTE